MEIVALQNFDEIKKNYDAISGIVGEVLLTGIIVVMLSSVAIVLYTIEEPVDTPHVSVEELVDASSNTIYLKHVGGKPIPVEDLKISVNVNGESYVYSPEDISENMEGKKLWEMADVIEIDTNAEWNISVTNGNDVTVKIIELDSKEVLPKYSTRSSSEDDMYFRIYASSGPGGSISQEGMIYAPLNSSKTFSITPASNYKILNVKVDRESLEQVSSYTFENISSNHAILAYFTPDFDIQEGAVIPKDSFISDFKVLGSAIKYGSYDMMVTTQIKVGNDTFDPWGYDLPVTGNVNDHTTHSWNLPSAYPAGTPITISSKAWQHKNDYSYYYDNYGPDEAWKGYMEVNSENNPDNVIILKNGDTVPDISGYLDQQPLEEFLIGYIDQTTHKVTMDENEAIFLFELGTTDLNSPAADFQDLVILVSVDSGEN